MWKTRKGRLSLFLLCIGWAFLCSPPVWAEDEAPTVAPAYFVGAPAEEAGLPAPPGDGSPVENWWQGISLALRIALFAGGLLLLALLVIFSLSMARRRRARRQRREIARIAAGGQWVLPEAGRREGPSPVQTNVAMRPPVYRPIRDGGAGREAAPANTVSLQIIGATGATERRVIRVTEGLIIGRGNRCSLRIRENTLAARHAALAMDKAGELTIAPLAEGFDVLVNGHAIAGACPLSPGDTISLGQCTLVVQELLQ